MAVIETQKEPRDVRAVLFVACLVIGFLALGGVIVWLVKPAGPKQVKLTAEQAKEAEASFVAPAPVLPPQPPIPQAKDPGPTRVTVDLKQVTTRQAITQIASQASAHVRPDGGGQTGFFAALLAQRTDVLIKDEPFWAAMLDLCRKGRLMPYADYQNPNSISLMQAGENQQLGPSVLVGSCAILLENVTSRFDANLTGPRPPDRSLTVSLKLLVEPRLKPYRISTVATLETAVDEKGNNLVRPREQWDDRSGGGGPPSNWMRDVTANLLFPDNAGNTIKTLKGHASVAVAGPDKTEKIENPLSARNVDIKVDGALLRFVELRRRGNDMYEARMAGDMNSPIFKEYEKFSKTVALFDANGKEFNRGGGSWGGGRANTLDFSVTFSARGDSSEPKELRITLPTQMREIQVPFEFNDLPLPH